MIVYRIAAAQYANKLFASGKPNRWNLAGDYVLYAATTRSLATLELVVHRAGIRMQEDFKMMVIRIADGAKKKTVLHTQLATDWHTMRGQQETQLIGHRWVERRKKVVMRVPSVVIPQEWNVVINTEHKEFKDQVKLIDLEPFAFDRRLR